MSYIKGSVISGTVQCQKRPEVESSTLRRIGGLKSRSRLAHIIEVSTHEAIKSSALSRFKELAEKGNKPADLKMLSSMAARCSPEVREKAGLL